MPCRHSCWQGAAPQWNLTCFTTSLQRKHDPCAGQWALPGGFVEEDEPLDKAAARELQEETGVNPADVLLTQASRCRCR